MDRIKSTAGQQRKLMSYRSGVGFLILKTSDNTTEEFEFFIKNGQPHFIASGEKVEFNFTPSDS